MKAIQMNYHSHSLSQIMRDRRVSIENITIFIRKFVLATARNVLCIHANPTCQRTSTHIFFKCYHIETYINTVN